MNSDVYVVLAKHGRESEINAHLGEDADSLDEKLSALDTACEKHPDISMKKFEELYFGLGEDSSNFLDYISTVQKDQWFK